MGVLSMDIFDPSGDHPTKVTFPKGKTALELDMMIAITVWFEKFYLTSLERISIMEHQQGAFFTVCISACRENVIDGYYRIRCCRNQKTLHIEWAKVQSLNGALLRLVTGKDRYRSVNVKSAEITADLLANFASTENKPVSV